MRPAIVIALLLGLLVAPAAEAATARDATVDLTAFRTRVATHPGLVRVVVDFTDGRLGVSDSEAADPDPFDGRASVDVRHARIQAQAPTVTAHGVTVRVTQHADRIRVRLSSAGRRFKYLDRRQLRSPERLVLDLYRSRPPEPAAEIPAAPDGCLAIASRTVRAGRITGRGTGQVFESQFQLVVRGADGRVKGRRGVTIRPGGSWSRTVPYTVSHGQAGTLEAADSSARDGALACLAQVRVRLRP